MSGKVSITEAANANIQLSEFRAAVNYENTKNKGYVRFTKTDGGRVTIGKINNKIDVLHALRTNIDARHNTEIRETIASLLSRDLKYVDKSIHDRIISLVKTGQAHSENEVVSTEALSRQELNCVFASFDREYNTARGRTNIIETMFRQAAERMGITQERLLKRHFCGMSLADLLPPSYNRTVEGQTEYGQEKMEMSEAGFRSLVHILEEELSRAEFQCKMEVSLKEEVKGWLDAGLGGTWGFSLGEAGKQKWAGLLEKALSALGITTTLPDGGTNLLAVFVDKVLPFELKTVMDNYTTLVRDGLSDDSLREELLDDLDIGHIINLAADFVREAQAATMTEVGAFKATGDEQVDRIAGLVNDTAERMVSTHTSAVVKLGGALRIVTSAAVTKEQALALSHEVADQMPQFAEDVKIDVFTSRFVSKRYGSFFKEPKLLEFIAMVGNKAQDRLDTVLVAAKLQYGENAGTFDPETGKTVYRPTTPGVEGFVTTVYKRLTEKLEAAKLSKDAAPTLVTHMLPSILKGKVERLLLLAKTKQEKGSLELSAEEANKAADELFAAAQVIEKSRKRFTKTLDAEQKRLGKAVARMVKAGKISEEEGVGLMGDFRAKALEAIRQGVHAFLDGAPYKDGCAKHQHTLESSVGLELEILVSAKQDDIAEAVLSRTIGAQYKRQLTDPKLVSEVFEAWKGANPGKSLAPNDYGLNLVSDEELVRKLTDGSLKRTASKTMLERLPKEEATMTTVTDVKKAIVKAGTKTIDTYRAFETKLVTALHEQIKSAVVQSLKKGTNWLSGYEKLDDKECEALAESLTCNTLHLSRDVLHQVLLVVLANPSQAPKGAEFDSLVDRLTNPKLADENLWLHLHDAIEERTAEARKWLEDGTYTNVCNDFIGIQRQRPENADLNEREIRNLVNRKAEGLQRKLRQYPLLATLGGRLDFCRNVADTVGDGLDARFAEYRKFRADFMKAVAPISANYAGLGAEALKKALAFVLAECADTEGPFSVDKAKALYEGVLADKLDVAVKEKYAAFADYEHDFDVASSTVSQVVDETLDNVLGDLLVRLGEETDGEFKVIEDFQKEFKAKVEAYFLNKVAMNPADYLYRDADEIRQEISIELDRLDRSLTELLQPVRTEYDIFQKSGYAYYCQKGEGRMYGLLSDTLKAFQGSRNGHELQQGYYHAMLTKAVAEFTGAPVPRGTDQKMEDFLNAAAHVLDDFVETNSNLEVLGKDLELANEMVEFELSKRKLPKLVDSTGRTVADRARERFLERIKQAAEQTFAGDDFYANPFNKEFFDGFVAKVRQESIEATLTEWKNTLVGKLNTEIVNTYQDDFTIPKEFGEVSSLRRNLDARIAFCKRELTALIENRLSETMFNFAIEDSVENAEAQERFEAEARKAIEEELPKFIEKVRSHIQFERELPDVVRSVVGDFVSNYFRDNIFSDRRVAAVLSPDFMIGLESFDSIATHILFKGLPVERLQNMFGPFGRLVEQLKGDVMANALNLRVKRFNDRVPTGEELKTQLRIADFAKDMIAEFYDDQKERNAEIKAFVNAEVAIKDYLVERWR